MLSPVPLGRTGLLVSPLCFGTGTNGWGGRSAQTGLGHRQLVELLEHAHRQGVTFWDSADQYGSHPHVKDALRRVGRDRVVFTTKTVAKTAADATRDVERFRQELGVDSLDILLLHCLTASEWPERMAPVMEALTREKEKGRIRALGVSCHHFGAFQRAADEPWVEVVLARLNHANLHMDASWPEVVEVLRTFRRRGAGVYGMKVLGAGQLDRDPAAAIEFVFAQKCVDAVTIGMRSRQEVEQNLQYVSAALAGKRTAVAAGG
ncbi:MAG: aldo/keto reductase [Armatimonadetes bacterium]|nr:aldo/keto reductase [Armatimonadota bacterium]